jgi:hypothetical protein
LVGPPFPWTLIKRPAAARETCFCAGDLSRKRSVCGEAGQAPQTPDDHASYLRKAANWLKGWRLPPSHSIQTSFFSHQLSTEFGLRPVHDGSTGYHADASGSRRRSRPCLSQDPFWIEWRYCNYTCRARSGKRLRDQQTATKEIYSLTLSVQSNTFCPV